MAESVVVGVRVRPYNQREKDLGATLCLEMNGPTTSIRNLNIQDAPPTNFTFDESFWSHDGFENDADGYSRPLPGSNYADQTYVFEKFGKRVLDNAWEGFHCCLFAYGQTGAGKSYSMVGYGRNKGIVPISCEEIFDRIKANDKPEKRYEVVVSVVEIYMEKVQDLLVDPDKRKDGGLDIRESKMLGVYIDGVEKRAVDNYVSIEQTIEEATNNRTVASTLMNATSSRAHTVLTIEFKQIETVNGKESMKVSMINLVDLAGSEKQKDTEAKGEVLRQATAINKSLSALGLVIEKLAAKSQGKKNVIVPYRDSKLTRLLQNALGGSSKTIMICALSPASTNYEETLSTLRYADRAKQIKNTAKVNENPQEKLMRELREENAKLKVVMEQLQDNMGTTDLSNIQEKLQELKDAQKVSDGYKEAMDRTGSEPHPKQEIKEEKARRGRVNVVVSAALSLPHIVNLNEDMLLTGRIKHYLPEGKVVRIGLAAAFDEADSSDGSSSEHGSSCADDRPDIVLSGVNIFHNHAIMRNEGHRCVLHSRGEAAHFTYVRGVKCSSLLREVRKTVRKSMALPKRQSIAARLLQPHAADTPGVTLNHGDTIAFGQCLFFFVDPSISPAEVLILSNQVSYAAARKEMARRRWEIPRKLIRIIGAMGRSHKSSSSSSDMEKPSDSEVREVKEMLEAKDRELQAKDELLTASNKENEQLKHLLDEAKCKLAAKESELLAAWTEAQTAREDRVNGDVGGKDNNVSGVGAHVTDSGSKGKVQCSAEGDFPDLSAEVSSSFEEVLKTMDRLEQHFAKH